MAPCSVMRMEHWENAATFVHIYLGRPACKDSQDFGNPLKYGEATEEAFIVDKRLLLTSAFGLFFFAVATVPAIAAKVDERATKCSIMTLEGSYIYWAQGYLDKEPYASAGIMSFDGKGRVVLQYTRSLERKQLTTEGTYAVMENCSGSMQLQTGTINQFYLAPNGNSFKWVRMTGEGAVGGEADRATRGIIVK